MNLWLAIALMLAVVSIYMFTIEIFSVAFKLTGLVTSKIRLQVASLFTGAGYTTDESELIAKDDKRRKIAIACMYTGHLFSVAFMGLLINVAISIAFYNNSQTYSWYLIVLYITAGLLLLMIFIKIPPINRRFQRFLENIALNASRKNKKTNHITVLDLHGKHATAEVYLNILPDFCKEVTLEKTGLSKKYSINILSIRRDSRYVEVSRDTMFQQGDVLLTYGLINDIREAFVYSVSKTKVEVETDKTNEINLINNYGNNALVEVFVVSVPEELKNIKIIDAKLKDKYGITIGIIKRHDEYVTVSKDTIIEKGDLVTLFGPYQNIKILFKGDENSQG